MPDWRRSALPADTLVRCPDLPDQPGHSFDHWRVFDIGDAVPLAEIPSREV